VRERSVSLPEGLRAEFDRLTEALRGSLFTRQLRMLRRELMPYAEAQGIYTDEDVFRATERRRSMCP
jgi:hypothetical protein